MLVKSLGLAEAIESPMALL